MILTLVVGFSRSDSRQTDRQSDKQVGLWVGDDKNFRYMAPKMNPSCSRDESHSIPTSSSLLTSVLLVLYLSNSTIGLLWYDYKPPSGTSLRFTFC